MHSAWKERAQPFRIKDSNLTTSALDKAQPLEISQQARDRLSADPEYGSEFLLGQLNSRRRPILSLLKKEGAEPLDGRAASERH